MTGAKSYTLSVNSVTGSQSIEIFLIYMFLDANQCNVPFAFCKPTVKFFFMKMHASFQLSFQLNAHNVKNKSKQTRILTKAINDEYVK